MPPRTAISSVMCVWQSATLYKLSPTPIARQRFDFIFMIFYGLYANNRSSSRPSGNVANRRLSEFGFISLWHLLLLLYIMAVLRYSSIILYNKIIVVHFNQKYYYRHFNYIIMVYLWYSMCASHACTGRTVLYVTRISLC